VFPKKLHPFQSDALALIRKKKTNLALTAATGAGKGVILEVLSADPTERILLFSPLIALARQQRVRFAKLGSEKRVWIISPESALLRRREIIKWKPTLIAVDEAHCLLEWGERFRPAYGLLLAFIRELECPRTLWMSATFPRSLFEEIVRELPGDWKTLGKFEMPTNLTTHYIRVSASERVEIVKADIRDRTGPGLLFAGTRKEVGQYLKIISPDRPTLPYHAGLSDEERRGIESTLDRDSSHEGQKNSVVATNAFGMGMNYPQFEWAILSRIPFSLLGLMQSFGRVARGGRSGSATLYWCEEDFRFAGLLTSTPDGPNRSTKELSRLRGFLESDEKTRSEITARLFL
jgi:superfamily II DNA helicase RecQ